MNLSKFADALDIMIDDGVDLKEFYVLAEYARAKEKGDVTIMALAKHDRVLSPTVMQRKIKKLVKKKLLVKVERPNDMRVKCLVDGELMPAFIKLLDLV